LIEERTKKRKDIFNKDKTKKRKDNRHQPVVGDGGNKVAVQDAREGPGHTASGTFYPQEVLKDTDSRTTLDELEWDHGEEDEDAGKDEYPAYA
jgi:hypothetical protein